ncbi:metal-dependent hydrolase [Streptomonospora litoralis]|uniref:Inner membrane protein n=1 Tax=Streptomonospora litoralis TaxID=2498135 RepID=A0A4V0ZKF0_9ACTN|nr:metal-dependent hydrolase [Streptomonospora litoralis]QBI56752.1 inner membrane protein [Streptomonospora litoralis]
MMGRTHAATGLPLGVAVGAAVDGTLPGMVIGAWLCAGAALLPDIDTPVSTAATALGPLTRRVSVGVRACSAAVWWATATKRDTEDERADREHRALTHTVPAAAAAGMLTAAATVWAPTAWLIVWALTVIALRGVLTEAGGRWSTATSAAGLTIVVMVLAPPHPVLVGAAVSAGASAHLAGDALTRQGVPLTWPLTHRGRRWWMWRSPLTIGTDENSRAERALRCACTIFAPFLGAWEMM